MEAEREANAEITEAQREALIRSHRQKLQGIKSVNLICDKCGNRLEPRCFDVNGEPQYAVFDNCTDLKDVQSFDSLQEAIDGYGEVLREWREAFGG